MKNEIFNGKIADEFHKIIDGDFDTAWFKVEMQEDTSSVGVYFKTGDEQYHAAAVSSGPCRLKT